MHFNIYAEVLLLPLPKTYILCVTESVSKHAFFFPFDLPPREGQKPGLRPQAPLPLWRPQCTAMEWMRFPSGLRHLIDEGAGSACCPHPMARSRESRAGRALRRGARAGALSERDVTHCSQRRCLGLFAAAVSAARTDSRGLGRDCSGPQPVVDLKCR